MATTERRHHPTSLPTTALRSTFRTSGSPRMCAANTGKVVGKISRAALRRSPRSCDHTRSRDHMSSAARSRVGMFRPETFGPSHALTGD